MLILDIIHDLNFCILALGGNSWRLWHVKHILLAGPEDLRNKPKRVTEFSFGSVVTTTNL